MDKRFFHFFHFSAFSRLEGSTGKSGKNSQRTSGKNPGKVMHPWRATKINLQYIPGHCLCGAPKATPSWILYTKSGDGGCGMYMLVRLSYLPVGSGLTQGKVQKTDFQPES